MQEDREEADTEVEETERARREMEMDGKIQKMRQSRSAAANICQSLVYNKEGSDVWP